MLRVSIGGCLAVLVLSIVAAAQAEQQVTLQSGATLVGEVSMEGADLSIDVDGAKIRVPMKDVATVTSTAAGKNVQAQQLLMKGLEAQLLYGGAEKDLGLLAEAHRLAPDDPHIAFWYARSMVNAGFGKGANEVFEPRRKAIAAAYPGVADQLARQIEDRQAVEKLPSQLVKRLDQIAAAAALPRPADAETTLYAAYFRLVDQADEPIPKSAFLINSPGNEANLESFSDGYYLYTYERRNGFGNSPCRLQLNKPELASDSIEFNGSYLSAENLGVLRIQRLKDADRLPVVVNVVDPDGKPLSGANVRFTVIDKDQGGRAEETPATTAADGTAKLGLFPGDYACTVTLKDYYPGTHRLTLPPDAKPPTTIDVKLFRAITATIKVEWRSQSLGHPGMPQFQNDAVTTGEFEQHLGPDAAGVANGPFGMPWVRLVQNGDQAQLQFIEHMGFGGPVAGTSWVGRWKRDAEDAGDGGPNPAADAEVFDLLDLAQLDAIKNEIQLERTNLGGTTRRGAPVALPVDAGDIYLGKLYSHDRHRGGPAVVEFKILATEVKRP